MFPYYFKYYASHDFHIILNNIYNLIRYLLVATKQNIKVPISVTINNKSYFSADDLNTFDAIYLQEQIAIYDVLLLKKIFQNVILYMLI